MSHEQSIGIEMNGRFFNLPTVYEGRKVSNDEAVDLFRQGKLRPLGQYSTQIEADREASKRSESFGHPPMSQSDGFSNFLSGLLDAISTGARGTADAFQQDADAVSQGQLPPQAMKAGGQVMQAYGDPSVNPVIPAMRNVKMAFDPAKGWYETGSKTYPGGDWTQMFTREGGLGSFLQQLLKSMELPRP